MSRHHLHRTKSSKPENTVRAFSISRPLAQQGEQAPVFQRPPAQHNHSASRGLGGPNSDAEVPITPVSPLRITKAPNIEEAKDWNKPQHRRSPDRQESFHNWLNSAFYIREGPFNRETNWFDTFRTPKKEEERDSPSVYSPEPSPVTAASQKVPSTRRFFILMCIMTVLGCLTFAAVVLSITTLSKAETAPGNLATDSTREVLSTTPTASVTERTATHTIDDLTSTPSAPPNPPSISSSLSPPISKPTHRTSAHKSTSTETSTHIINVRPPPDKRDQPLLTSCDLPVTITTTLTTTTTLTSSLPVTTNTTSTLSPSATPSVTPSSNFAQRRYHAPFAWASMKKWLRNTNSSSEERSKVRVVSVADVVPTIMAVGEEDGVVERILSTASANAA